jgi:hypothetical protein
MTVAASTGTTTVTGAITANGHQVASFTFDVPVVATLRDGQPGVIIGPIQPALAEALLDIAVAFESEE